VSIVALIVALGGTSYAAFSLPNNSVGTKQLKKHAVTTNRIKNGAVTLRQISAAAQTALKVRNVVNGVNGKNGVNGVNGTARAYARVIEPGSGGGIDHAKGVASATHVGTGIYCVNAPGIDPSVESAAVSVDSQYTVEPVGNTSAMTYARNPDCPAGQFEVVTERQANLLVCTDPTCVGVGHTTDVAGKSVPNDSVSFTIVIP
jgi:hypothetical protein